MNLEKQREMRSDFWSLLKPVLRTVGLCFLCRFKYVDFPQHLPSWVYPPIPFNFDVLDLPEAVLFLVHLNERHLRHLT